MTEDRAYEVLNSKECSMNEVFDIIDDYEVDRIEGNNGRWAQNMVSIVKVKDKYFAINWLSGLTELQSDDVLYIEDVAPPKKKKRIVEMYYNDYEIIGENDSYAVQTGMKIISEEEV